MATLTSATTTAMADNLQLIKLAAFETGQSTTWSAIYKQVMLAIQTDAIAADATAQTYLTNNRKFVQNNSGATKTVTYNGTTFSLLNATTYCCSPNEAEFFFAQATTLGYTFVRKAVADFAAGGAALFFFE